MKTKLNIVQKLLSEKLITTEEAAILLSITDTHNLINPSQNTSEIKIKNKNHDPVFGC